jgi:hypothetical protein
MQCISCGGDCGRTKKLGCQYTGGGQSIKIPTDDALRVGIKQFQRARHSENDPLNDWRIFYITVSKLTSN